MFRTISNIRKLSATRFKNSAEITSTGEGKGMREIGSFLSAGQSARFDAHDDLGQENVSFSRARRRYTT